MDFQFSMFEPKKPRKAKVVDPCVEVSRHGRIIFNTAAMGTLADSHYCKLGFDQQNRAVGILPLQEPEHNSFPIRYTAKGAYIGAKRFFSYFKILPSERLNATPLQSGNYIGIKV